MMLILNPIVPDDSGGVKSGGMAALGRKAVVARHNPAPVPLAKRFVDTNQGLF